MVVFVLHTHNIVIVVEQTTTVNHRTSLNNVMCGSRDDKIFFFDYKIVYGRTEAENLTYNVKRPGERHNLHTHTHTRYSDRYQYETLLLLVLYIS